ncbi:AraC family transcriptional regulator [Glaciimonas immobilis]|uniref:AraC-like DNA-binding protein n=1 Tax=Glaciimonas immobilis TaxID=728004 RepID=A0A840RWP5_9BURK|nr:AraC family transcriptional regulator [Glaciimonas immobilis]KAF3996538.1 AraC family transcriptional regulator [Glaciimonas immobilis]MBB5201094.1 AraC-like DNA-binding protein [Glaciimonas immobilis]
MDRLTPLLNHFSLRAGIFYTGNICGIHDFQEDALRGHIHLIRKGPARIFGVQKEVIDIIEPTILFLPRPKTHSLIADDRAGADVVCGTIQFGSGGGNPITDSLPSVVLVQLAALPGVEALMGLMFDEALSAQSGSQAVLDRLCEVLMIRLLRYCIDQGLTQGGTLAGLADSRLAKALIAIQTDPARAWTLSDMAAAAGMSRARFAVRFRAITGQTPADYLASWRVVSAQRLLLQGLQLKQIAFDVGYGSASTLTRVFVRKLGRSPIHWLKEQSETQGHQNETHGALPKPRVE